MSQGCIKMSTSKPEDTYSCLKVRFRLKDEDLRASVSDAHLDKISKSVDLPWKTSLPVQLTLNHAVVTDIQCNTSLTEEGERRLQFLFKWKKVKGEAATYQRLILSLLRLGRRQDAESVCAILQNPESGMSM